MDWIRVDFILSNFNLYKKVDLLVNSLENGSNIDIIPLPVDMPIVCSVLFCIVVINTTMLRI